MSFNIVDLIKDQVTDAVLEKAGGLLGADAPNLSSGLEGAIPALLGGITGAANAPGKSEALFDAVNQADDGLLSDFAGALGGANSGQMIEQGSSMLSGLMGSGMMNNLGSVLSSVSGMSRGGTGSLLGMLAPIVMGVLKKKVLGGGMNAGGLLSMMNDQKANIASAMPANLSSQLGSIEGFPKFDGLPSVSGIADGVTGAASDAMSSASAGVGAAADKLGDAGQQGVEAVKGSGGGIGKWLIPIAAALGLGWFAMNFLGKGDTDVNVPDASDATAVVGEATTAATDAATSAVTDATAGASDAVTELSGTVTGMFNQASETLGGITDVESATAALPGLEEISGQVSSLPDLFDNVPEVARGPLQGMVTEGMGSLQPIVDKLRNIPGVGPVLEPVIAPMLETLSGLGG